ncbi:MAG: plasmid pRiA4b ORF-3 family protein [Candidatus Zixiibacteriota bacterium]
METKRRTLQFKITLADVEPAVWRRIEVPAGYTFWDLHVAVQDAMGWLDCHLHMFRIRNPGSGEIEEIGIPDEHALEGDPICLPGWEISVARYFDAVGASARYEYDFGDDWVHEIVLEAIGSRQAGTRFPRCLAGERACPPEDCGGPPGYAQLLKTIADPSDEEHERAMQWLGGSFDPDSFSPQKVRFDDPKMRWRVAFAGEEYDPDAAAG